MQTIIGIIIAIIVICLTVKLAVWLIKWLLKILPYLIGAGVVGFAIYGIIYVIKNKIGTGFGNVINFVLQVLYFGVVFCVLIIIGILISEILKLMKIRWLMIPILASIILYHFGSMPEGYSITNPTAFALAVVITLFIYCWGILQLIRIKVNIGFNDTIDSNIMMYYGGIGAAFGFIYLYFFNFPNNVLETNFNSAIYLYVLVYLGVLVAAFSINRQVSIYVKVKKFINQNRICTINDILTNPLSAEAEKEKSIYAELIILKMKKHKFIFEINLKSPLYIQATIYKGVLREFKNGKSFDGVIEAVESEFNIKLSQSLIEAIYRTGSIKKGGQSNQIILQESKSEPYVEQKDITIVTNKIVDEELHNEPKILSTIQEVVSNQVLEEKKHTITETEFMLLRYNIYTHPIVSAKPSNKELYFNLLSYILKDLKDTATSVNVILKNYIKILGLNENNLESLDKPSTEMKFKKIGKKEILREGFLKYRLRDYRFLLLLEVFYFRYVLTNKIEYDLINNYCIILNINEKTKSFIIKYIELLVKENSVNDAETLLLNCRNKYILSTVWSLHNNILGNNLYSDLPRYNVVVCATMSSGKSTFINALLGKDYIPSKNEACTAKITTISDNDRLGSVIGMVFDSNDKYTCHTETNLQLLEEWNNKNEVKKILLESNLDGIKSNKGIVVINDTPGTNYSQDESHNNSTMDFIKTNQIDMVIYIINAEHASTTDNQILLKQIKVEVINKQSSQILFLVNKIDSFDEEKNDDINSCLQGVKNELIEYGYNNPQIIPVSANAARLFKMVLKGQQLSKKETVSFKNLFELFFTDNLDLLKFCDHRETANVISVDANAAVNIGNNEYKHTDILTALHRTGITLVEALLDNQINN